MYPSLVWSLRRRLIALALGALCVFLGTPQAQAAVDFSIQSTAQTYVGGSGAQAIDTQATAEGDDFTNAMLRVAIAPGKVPSEDVLLVLTRAPTVIAQNGSISVDLGTSVVVASYAIGSGPTDLEITFNGVVTPAQVREVLRSVAYRNLAGATPTTGARTVTFTMTRSAVPTVQRQRDIDVSLGNAVPGVTTNLGLTLGRSQFADLRGNLITTDTDHGANVLTYAPVSLPSNGRLIRKNTVAGASQTVLTSESRFTQQDITAGLIAYEHLGGAAASDGFTFQVSDPLGATTPVTAVAITITGSLASPVISLPGPWRAYVEDEAALTVVALVDAGAGAPVFTAAISDSDSPHFRQATLEVTVVTAGGAPALRAGDQFAVSSSPGAPVDGSFTVSGATITYRWAGTDYPFATIDPQADGVDGTALRLTFADMIRVGAAGGATPYQISEIITPATVARLIERLTYRSTDQAPDGVSRLVRVRLEEASPNTGVGTTTAALQVMPVNDAPVFTVPPTPTWNLTALSGIALPLHLTASDPDSSALGYAVASKSVPDQDATAVMDAASGVLVVTPAATFTGTITLVVTVTDGVGGIDQLTITITAIPPPSSANRPFIVSDPPLEIEAGSSLLHRVVIRPDPSLGALQTATFTFIGQVPPGLSATQLGGNVAIHTLTTAPLAVPELGSYRFGMVVSTTSTLGSAACYQPVTLRVRALGAAN